jgi:hypothetical protein
MAKRKQIDGNEQPVAPAHPCPSAGHHHYSLPSELLEAVVEVVGESHFDSQMLARDRSLSADSGDHSSRIGTFNGAPIKYDLLNDSRSASISFLEAEHHFGKDLPWLRTAVKNMSMQRELDRRLEWIGTVSRGYAGWLALNPVFEKEQRSLLSKWTDLIRSIGFSKTATTKPSKMGFAPLCLTPDLLPEFTTDRDRFLQRWRLLDLAGPYLPRPVRTMIPLLRSLETASMIPMGAMIFLADIFPLPDRTLLKQMLEGAMGRTNPPEHLKEWIQLVESDNPAKKSMERFGRIFRLQHYWGVLFARYREALDGSQSEVRRAFASWLFPKSEGTDLEAKADTLRKDINRLNRVRGGTNWFLKPSIYNRF